YASPSRLLVLFALVFSWWHDAIVHRVRMKHYRDEVKEKETEAPAGRCERCQQHKDPDRDRSEHPQKPRKLVSFINMAQARNDTKDNCDGVARFAFRSFRCAACPITAVAALGIFRQEMPAVWTGHFIARAGFWPGSRCIRVLHTHFNY